MIVVAGDVGGTKTLLSVEEGGREVAFHEAATADRAFDFAALVEEVLAGRRADRVAVGVAGPVKDGRARLSNVPGAPFLDARALAERLGAEVLLFNDLVAQAWAVRAHLDGVLPLETRQVRKGSLHASAAVLGVGTGLGVATLRPESPVPLASEGGHRAFAAVGEEQRALAAWMETRHGAPVSWERVLSGPGLAELHAFYSGARGPPGSAHARADEVARAAAEGESAAAKAVRLLFDLAAQAAAGLALEVGGGAVFLTGGPLRKNLAFLDDERFRARFETSHAPAPVRGILLESPVVLVTDARVAERGARVAAGRVATVQRRDQQVAGSAA